MFFKKKKEIIKEENTVKEKRKEYTYIFYFKDDSGLLPITIEKVALIEFGSNGIFVRNVDGHAWAVFDPEVFSHVMDITNQE